MLGFQCYSIWEDLSIDALITNYCRTDIGEAKVIYFLGVLTDRILEFSYGNMSANKKFQLKAQN